MIQALQHLRIKRYTRCIRKYVKMKNPGFRIIYMLSLRKTHKQTTVAKEVTENQTGLFLLYQSIANITMPLNYN